MTTTPPREIVDLVERVLRVARRPGGGVLHGDLCGLLALAADRLESRRDRRRLLKAVGALWGKPPALLTRGDVREHFARDRLPSWAVMLEESHTVPNQ